jgi:fibronectin-binding autotransporter adhesin
MAISGEQVILVGLQNESANSDSLYTAFNKTKDNFATLFACSSPFNTFANGAGIETNTNSNTNTITITNTGVVSLTAGDSSINLTGSNGNITITASGGGNGGGVSSVGVSSSTLSVSNTPILSAGNIVVNLPVTGITAATYTNPTVTVDTYGRVTNIANNTVSGTVTSVGITPGTGILVTNSPITSSGNITVTNTGVTRISAGTGIGVSGSNGDVTISATSVTNGTVTGVTITSNNLTVTGGTITSSGTISVDLPSAITLTGNITAGNVLSNGRMILNGSEDLAASAAANLLLTASYFTTTTAETATLAAGTNGQLKTFMMVGDGGDMVITVTNAGWKSSGTGTMTFDTIGAGCTLQYIASKWFCIGNNGVVFA